MTDPISEVNVATQRHFMPVVTNQIFVDSPVLYRIFRPAKAGQYGLALPSFDGRSIAEPLEIGEVGQEAVTYSTGTIVSIANGETTVTGSGTTWTENMSNRGFITLPDGKAYAIDSVTSATTLEIASPYEGASVSSGSEAYSLTYYADIEHSSGAYNKDTVWTAGSSDVLAAAEFPWKMYHTTLKIHNLDSTINKGRERMFDIVALKMRNATRILRKNLITDFYSKQFDGGDGMVGLQAIVAKSGVVGGIEKRKYEWWQGVIVDADNKPLSWDLLNKVWHRTKLYGNGDPATLIVTSEGALQAYEEGLNKVVTTGETGSRYPNIYMTMAADKARKKFDAGFEGFSFKGIPMIADPLLPASISDKAFFINENYIHWRVLKNFESTGWQQLRSQGKDWAQMTIFGYGTLTSSCNRKFGEIDNLTESV